MLKFSSFDNAGNPDDRPLRQTVLIDKDELVVPGRVRLRDGVVSCERRSDGATALRLLYDAGDPGELALRTCLLSQREEPYILSVELARHRIGTFVHKAEDWHMVNLDEAHPAMQLWDEARRIFTKAMVTTDPVQADRAGRASLALAIRASERLAVAHGEILLRRRFSERPAPSTAIGVRVDPARRGEALRELARRHFRLLAVPLRWDRLCPKEGVYHWDDVDDWIGWAEDHKCRVIAGPLVDLGRHGLPGWVASRAVSYEHLRDLAYEHVKQVVNRYGDHIGMWSIGAGINTNTLISLQPKEMVDLVRTLALRIRQDNRGRRVIVEIEQPWSEYLFSQRDAVDPGKFVERLVQSGIRLDAIGLRLRMGDSSDGRTMRDLMEISRLLDRYMPLDASLIVTDLGVPDAVPEECGGRWRGAWDRDRQAMWAAKVIPLLLSKPRIESVIWTDLYDHDETRPPGAGLISDTGAAKQVFKIVAQIRKHLSKPLQPVGGS